TSPLNLSWRRDLIGHKLVAWNGITPRLAYTVLLEEYCQVARAIWHIGISKELKLLSLLGAVAVCSLFGYPLALFLGCATEAYLPGVGFGYLSTFLARLVSGDLVVGLIITGRVVTYDYLDAINFLL
ncbi:hypothetical protein ACJX0J_022455, partial [Zea mays]